MRLTERGRFWRAVIIAVAVGAAFWFGAFGLAGTCWHPETSSYGSC